MRHCSETDAGSLIRGDEGARRGEREQIMKGREKTFLSVICKAEGFFFLIKMLLIIFPNNLQRMEILRNSNPLISPLENTITSIFFFFQNSCLPLPTHIHFNLH